MTPLLLAVVVAAGLVPARDRIPGEGWLVSINYVSEDSTRENVQTPIITNEADAVSELERIEREGCWFSDSGQCSSARPNGSRRRLTHSAIRSLELIQLD